MLYLLRTHGITDVVLAMGYLSQGFQDAYGDGSHLGMNLTYVHEAEPLDTGGAIKNVQSHLTPGETFFVFNGDVLTDLDITGMLRLHRDNVSVCTISLTAVDDPSQYGVVDMDEAGRIQRFTEKPKREEATSNWINAGTYILEPQVLDYIPAGQRYSVERGLFPTLLQDGKPLFGYRTSAYWMDIGTPEKYLQAQADLLGSRLQFSLAPDGELYAENVWVGEGSFISKGVELYGPVVIGRGCRIEEGVSITGPTVLGDGCSVGRQARLENMIALKGVQIDERANCSRCILGNGAHIGDDCRIEGMAIVGDNASLGTHNYLTASARISPDVAIPDRAIFF